MAGASGAILNPVANSEAGKPHTEGDETGGEKALGLSTVVREPQHTGLCLPCSGFYVHACAWIHIFTHSRTPYGGLGHFDFPFPAAELISN